MKKAVIETPIAYTVKGRPLYDNTPTVVAVLAVVDDKLLVVRRNNEPGRGRLGLPGGYHMRGESWQTAGCREVFQETGYTFDPASMRMASFVTDEYDNNLVIAHNLGLLSETPTSYDKNEVQEVLLLDGPPGDPKDWAFPRHYQAALDLYNCELPLL